MNKKILGLDLGTNSIGWALVEQDAENKQGKILGMGSRIIPMSQDILGKFDSGQSISQTAERTRLRGIRRLRERNLLRRERLHRVLNVLKFLPEHYSKEIDFENRLGQFFPEKEPKLAYKLTAGNTNEFIFKDSFHEMITDFKKFQPKLFYLKNSGEETKFPYDWTIYYLRKKALSERIEKEELAWILLNFNQKRGYYQLRGEEEEVQEGKEKTYEVLKVGQVIDSGEKINGKNLKLYDVIFENGWKYDKQIVKTEEWIGKTKEFIVTTSFQSSGEIKRTYKAVDSEQDWIAIKKKAEQDVLKSNKTVGLYIYDTLLQNPNQKIRGKLIRTIERIFYKKELFQILEKQKEYHPELKDLHLYKICLNELYKQNESHKNNIAQRDFTYLFLEDIIFYQRPLKSKKSLISDCSLEHRFYTNQHGVSVKSSIKCIAKSHPLYQEFRLLQWLKNLKIFKKTEKEDIEITDVLIQNEEDKKKLYQWLNDKTEIDQNGLLKYPDFDLESKLLTEIGVEQFRIFKKDKELGLSTYYRWNYVEDKKYPLNETRGEILKRLNKNKIDISFLTKENEESLWHLLYSVVDKKEVESALTKFAHKHRLPADFIESFKNFPQFKKDYGTFSAKAIKKLLPLMRFGEFWNASSIDTNTLNRIEKIITGEYDAAIRKRVREKSIHLNDIHNFKDLPQWLASYIIYDRHSEIGEITYWKKAEEIQFLKQHALRNPIVEQVINETLQVIKDIWQHYGNGAEGFFDEIHVELGREMKNPADQRAKMTKQISENENTNLRIKALLAELAQDQNIENVRPHSPMQQEILKIFEEGVYQNEQNDKEKEEIEKIRKKTQPSSSELKKYKLWLEQGYKSPYTGAMIPLSKLFTPSYEIEHIIPQSRYFDDSLSNKIICEAEVNKLKDNQLAYEFIKNNQGLKIELSHGKYVQLYNLPSYELNVKQYFMKNKSKMTKLLLEEIPESFIQRQLNDSRYISKVVKSLLSNLVREEGESEGVAKNVISSNGSITSRLKQDWGLHDVWNELISPRFERLNKITGTQDFGKINENTGKFLPQVPLELSKGFNKKRIDHRHHAVDALVVACTTRNHINYLNNESASENKKSERFDLRNKLRHLEEYNDRTGKKRVIAKDFIKPWPGFTKDAKDLLNKIIVSFKSNHRVINKTVNRYQNWENKPDGTIRKVIKKQTKGDSWAIRKPIHKDTVSGLVNLQFKKSVNFSSAIDNWESIANKALRFKIKEMVKAGLDKKKILSHFKSENYIFNGENIAKVEIYYFTNENQNTRVAASRVKLDESFTSTKIESITDSGIQKILLRHLENYIGRMDENSKPVAPEVLAFSADGIEALNSNLRVLNNGKYHAPIYKVRTYETFGNKFCIGTIGNKKAKYVEAAKGTNLFFAIYIDEKGKRSYETIPLNVVIERQKQGLPSVPEQDENGNPLLFHLSPNDLVYVPTEEEKENPNLVDFENLSSEKINRIYKFTDASGTTMNFMNCNISDLLFNINFKDQEKKEIKYSIQNELGVGSPQSKNQKSFDGEMIKDICWKLHVDRLGNIKPIFPIKRNQNFEDQIDNRIQAFSEPSASYITNPKLSFFSDLPSMSEAESGVIAALSMEERLKLGLELIRRVYGDKDISPDFPGKITIKKYPI